MRILLFTLLALIHTVIAQNVCGTPPPILDVAKSSSTGGNLTLTITASTAYQSVSTIFVGASNADACSSGSGSSSWWYVAGTTGCLRSLTITNAINDMISNCGFNRDESNTGFTLFKSTIVTTTVKAAGQIRGVDVTTTEVTSVEVNVAFQTRINATQGPLQVFGPVISLAQIITQTMTLSPFTLIPHITITLLTQSQYPYQLAAPVFSTVTTYEYTIVPVTPDAAFATASVCNATGSDKYMAGDVCTQKWTITIAPINSCPEQRNLNHLNWTLTYQVRCHSSFTGSCASPDPSINVVMFDTSSADYCPEVISNSAVATAVLNTYDDSQFSHAQNQFVFGTRNYYLATVTSPILLSDVNIERITILSGAAPGVTDLYTKTFTSSSTYFGTTGSYTNSVNNAPTLMTVQDSNGGTNTFARNVSFSWVWNSIVSGATGDNPIATTIFVAMRVRFADQSTISSKLVFALHNNKMGLSSTTGSASSSTLVGVAGEASTTTDGAAAASTAMDSTALIAVVAVAAIVALVIGGAAVVVIKRARRLRQQNSQDKIDNQNSVNLDSVSSMQ